ncbi:4Fe-4S binding protein, partial [Chloroflexota bacterium]
DPADVPTSEPGEKAGLGTYHYQNIEIVGDDVESIVDKSFEVVRKPPITTSSGRVRTFLRNRICPRPVIDVMICNNCGTCVKQCPVNPKAVNWYNGDESIPPTYKYDRCIRCYCCQELCPEGAITVKETLLGRAIFH